MLRKHQVVWIHGDIATGDILIDNNTLSAAIDCGSMAMDTLLMISRCIDIVSIKRSIYQSNEHR